MAANRDTIERALLFVLNNPVAVIPADHTDAVRAEAAADLAAMDYRAYINDLPQESPHELQVTINRLGGLTPVNVDTFSRIRWPIIEIETWARIESSRTNRQALLDLGECLNLLLFGLTGTFEGVVISGIGTEVEPIQQGDPPSDGSDRWGSGYTFTYEIQYEGTWPDERIAVGVTGP